MKDALRDMELNESVEVLYRDEVKGAIVPAKRKKKYISKDHPFFGMWADDPRTVEEIMGELRKPRYSDLW